MSFTKYSSGNIIRYCCTMSSSYIVYIIENNEADISDMYMDEDDIKLYVMLLNSSLDDLKVSTNCKKIKQIVQKSEWDSFLKDDKRWTLKTMDNECCEIECSIDEAAECILRGFGFDVKDNKNL